MERMSISCRLPLLEDIVANLVAPPYTLSAFREFVDHNHCSEVLDFILDVRKYKSTYHTMTADMAYNVSASIINCYVRSNAPKEINLACHTRDELLQSADQGKVDPKDLEVAYSQALDLLKDNVYIPFVAMMRRSGSASYTACELPISPALTPKSVSSQSSASLSEYTTHRSTHDGVPEKVTAVTVCSEVGPCSAASKKPIWKSTFKWLKPGR
uniref:ARAD1A00902p n=1 Tax=Blastobotrys adeninivorans TaxID=409370 RepID=A0A060T2C9_BLAAD